MHQQPTLLDELVQTSAVIQSLLKDLAENLDTSVLHVRMLGILRDRTPTMGELGRLLGLDTSSITGLVDRTESREVVRRVRDSSDRRVIRVELTPQGRRVVEESTQALSEHLNELTAELDATQQSQLATLLSGIAQRFAASKGIDVSTAPAFDHANARDVMNAAEPGPAAFAADGRVAVIIGSTRPGRICPGVAQWVRDELADHSPLTYELVDLAAIDLPFLDEPLMAALHAYAQPHTVAWSHLIDSFGGFVFVFPQYNWGYPAVLKNALDFLYDEWKEKPASMVSYGTRGGNRGIAQLGSVLRGLEMILLHNRAEVTITHDDVDAAWQLIDLDAVMAPSKDQITAIAEEMTSALMVPSTASPSS